MFKARILLFLFLFIIFSGVSFSIFAQGYDDDNSSDDIIFETDWDGYFPELYSRGDQTFSISLGVIFPLFFLNNGSMMDHNFSPPVGGTGSLAYTHFLSPNFFLGGEIGIMFNSTLGNNTVFFIPIGLRTGWQFIFKRLEIPLTITAGVVPQTYLDYEYAGFFLRGGISFFYRFSPEWSFGLNSDWNWFPQWPKEKGERIRSKNVDSNILGLTISGRYHF